MSGLKWSGLLLVALVAGAASFWWLSPGSPEVKGSPTDEVAVTDGDTAQTQQDSEQYRQLAEQQEQAARAVEGQLGEPEFEGPVSERPDFVSPIEWRVLKSVAAGKADSDRELTRLVNRIRFAKLREHWDELRGSGQTDQRHAIARQLLEDIPNRVDQREMDVSQAQQLQQQLLADLISDPERRRQRAAEEARRIGITFEMQASRS
ncbi:hypothetical protein [Alloalcanivorax marinus]|uniref:hypothetical protein n=1 Tax=Alloalcanivorax marinus TaxID=1177169 RepID=UPI00195B4A17|nr:hypothetical protein [Alloalcanivorax marinus]MBM7334376.1 hypothetical protein [Alloalcanivorax marinus]